MTCANRVIAAAVVAALFVPVRASADVACYGSTLCACTDFYQMDDATWTVALRRFLPVPSDYYKDWLGESTGPDLAQAFQKCQTAMSEHPACQKTTSSVCLGDSFCECHYLYETATGFRLDLDHFVLTAGGYHTSPLASFESEDRNDVWVKCLKARETYAPCQASSGP